VFYSRDWYDPRNKITEKLASSFPDDERAALARKPKAKQALRSVSHYKINGTFY